MIAFTILDQKDFTSKLLLQDVFDHFWFFEGFVTTFNTFTIDGQLHHDFFDSSQDEIDGVAAQPFSCWKDVRPILLSLIKGNRPPISFKFILQLPGPQVAQLLSENGLPLHAEDVTGLYMNLQFHDGLMSCTTGSSLRFFTLDKTLDVLWDNTVLSFFRQNGMPFEQG
ncbi:MAG: DUF5721 family protein [Lachnospiraceae bacterium]